MKREQILTAAMDVISRGSFHAVTLDSVAKEVGLTKPGLIHYFPTKHALMTAIVEHSTLRWENELFKIADKSFSTLTVFERYEAYIKVNLSLVMDTADYIIVANALYGSELARPLHSLIKSWCKIPKNVNDDTAAKLISARFISEKYWENNLKHSSLVSSNQSTQIKSVIDGLLREVRHSHSVNSKSIKVL